VRRPVILATGQQHTDPAVGALLRTPGKLFVAHGFDGRAVVAVDVGFHLRSLHQARDAT
jgi:hypothetical protein